MSYDRVLPKPPALYHDSQRRDLPAARTSTPLAHKIMTDRFSKAIAEQNEHQSAPVEGAAAVVPYRSNGAALKTPSSAIELTAALSTVPRKRTVSLITSEATRQERATSTSSSKSSSSRDSNIQFCLCQPDPKIPRPRNGLFLFLFNPVIS